MLLSEESVKQLVEWAQFGSLAQYRQLIQSQSSADVVNWNKYTGGSSRWERTLWKKHEMGDIVLLRDEPGSC